VPKEKSLEKIPTDPMSDLKKCGISPGSITSVSKKNKGNQYPNTLRGIVIDLRHSVAHFTFKPVHKNRIVKGFHFTNRAGFEATIDVAEMRDFVEKLAHYLEQRIQ
jgi:hypothetical protein